MGDIADMLYDDMIVGMGYDDGPVDPHINNRETLSSDDTYPYLEEEEDCY